MSKIQDMGTSSGMKEQRTKASCRSDLGVTQPSMRDGSRDDSHLDIARFFSLFTSCFFEVVQFGSAIIQRRGKDDPLRVRLLPGLGGLTVIR